MQTLYAKHTESVETTIGDIIGADDGPAIGEYYQINLEQGKTYGVVAMDACGCGCHREAALIRYIDDDAPLDVWLCASHFVGF